MAINVRIDDSIKLQAEDIFKSIGVTTTAAIVMFFKKTIEYGRLPFDFPTSTNTSMPMSDTEELKEQAEKVCWEMGLDGGAAMAMLYSTIINEKRLPISLTYSVNKDLAANASDVCEELGITLEQALEMFMKSVIRHKRLPAELTSITTAPSSQEEP